MVTQVFSLNNLQEDAWQNAGNWVLTKDISVNTRKDLYTAIGDMIADKPIFGYGTGFDNVRQMLENNGGYSEIESDILMDKVITFAADQAQA